MLRKTQSISKETKGHSTSTSRDTKQPYLLGTRRNVFLVAFAFLLALITHSLFSSYSYPYPLLPSSAQLNSESAVPVPVSQEPASPLSSSRIQQNNGSTGEGTLKQQYQSTDSSSSSPVSYISQQYSIIIIVIVIFTTEAT
jgi:hypothetical protein